MHLILLVIETTPVYYELSLLRNYAKLCESMLKKAFESFVLFLEVVITFKNIHFSLITFFHYTNTLAIRGPQFLRILTLELPKNVNFSKIELYRVTFLPKKNGEVTAKRSHDKV